MNDTVLESISKSCTNLEILDVHKCINLTDQSAASIGMLKLKKLNFSKTSVNYNNLKINYVLHKLLGHFCLDNRFIFN